MPGDKKHAQWVLDACSGKVHSGTESCTEVPGAQSWRVVIDADHRLHEHGVSSALARFFKEPTTQRPIRAKKEGLV